MAVTNYFVDPAAGSDANSGTVGSPWATTQHALNTIVQGAGGDQINIKAGTDDTLSAALTLATYGSPTATKPLIFRGYTSVANDGGIGGLNGNALYAILNDTTKGPILAKDLHLHNCGANAIWTASGNSDNTIEHCEADTGTAGGLIVTVGTVLNCYVHDVSGTNMISASLVSFNRLEALTKNATNAINSTGIVNGNTIAVASSTNGINTVGGAKVTSNSVWANAGTGKGITIIGGHGGACVDNIVEGFSGTGGVGINSTGSAVCYGNNKLYNNTTQVNPVGGGGLIIPIADTINTASSFNNPGGAPADLSLNTTAGGGAVSRGSNYPGAFYGSPFTSYRDSGAVQHADPVGGATQVFSHRRLIVTPPRLSARRRPAIIPAAPVTVPIVVPARRRPYPVYLPVRRNVAGVSLFAAPIVLRAPARQTTRQNYVRRNAGQALFSSVTNNVTQTVLVSSPRKVR